MNNHNSVVLGSEGGSLESAMAQAPNTVTSPTVTTITSQVSSSTAHAYNGNTGEQYSMDYAAVNAGEGATIFSNKGTPKAFIDSGDDLVTYQGMPVKAQTLEKMGILKQNPQGQYDFIEQASAASPEQQQQSTNAHDAYAMSEEENQVINEALPANLPTGSLESLTSRGVDGIITGDLSSAVKALSQTSGQSPVEAAKTVSTIVETYSKAADKYLAGTVGMQQEDIQSFYEWSRTHNPSELKAAVSSIIGSNKFTNLGKLVGSWAKANPPSEHSLKAAGFKVGKSHTGESTVFIKGAEMSIKAAARAGLL